MKHKVDVSIPNIKLTDNRDIGETTVHLKTGEILSVSIECMEYLIQNAYDNAPPSHMPEVPLVTDDERTEHLFCCVEYSATEESLAKLISKCIERR